MANLKPLMRRFIKVAAIFLISSLPVSADDYAKLQELFQEWRSFEVPPQFEGAPDYRAETFDRRHKELQTYINKLNNLDTSDWTTEQRVDWHILRAELSGYDFNHRVLKPWARDPAFYKSVWTYKSDVPAHEGPSHHALTELWTYNFPLSKSEEDRLISDLKVIPPLYAQAKQNLVGNARELWIAGIRDIDTQASVLNGLRQDIETTASPPLMTALNAAIDATTDLADWLRSQADSKTGPSGIGKDNYTWYQQNVHLVPLTWEDEFRLLKRELDRAWSSLKLEEHRNRHLPALQPAANAEEYNKLAQDAANTLLTFLDKGEVVTVEEYFRPALEAHLGEYVPAETRNFFYIGSHLDPLPLFSHFYHWFELARMDHDPHPNPMRRGPMLYNIFDSRNEGTATAVEEIFMHAGLYDNNPRSREIVWIMLAQRAARGLGSLYAHANEMTMEDAGKIHMDWTPRGWMKTEKELLIFEQHLYLRQPGYGTSYITGKYLLERAMADYAKQCEEQGKPFVLRDFFDELNAIGGIPIALGRWQMTGKDNEIQMMMQAR
ncbi:hypothetical protein GCM10017044_27100 [Kordiimonas sediminis]|uniref:DUF885 domain-containing protein n=1 Tax=Kordiimonas sediminis TaxID=1735581 RepID=A0A919E944_9PROT|nr:DUF885 family protein [Kordiimonas sediminis]GHF30292.1 hypothetical protein GCM10017044_27100 [Kordiimonas sediminis]